jgi:hypothetical protein
MKHPYHRLLPTARYEVLDFTPQVDLSLEVFEPQTDIECAAWLADYAQAQRRVLNDNGVFNLRSN